MPCNVNSCGISVSDLQIQSGILAGWMLPSVAVVRYKINVYIVFAIIRLPFVSRNCRKARQNRCFFDPRLVLDPGH